MHAKSQITESEYAAMMEEGQRREVENDFIGALENVQKALSRAKESHVVTTLEDHLRIPRLLYRLGRKEEARSRFTKLLTYGYSDQLENDNILWLERSLIYESMRDLYAEDGNEEQAVLHDALAYVAEVHSRFLDHGRGDYDHDASDLMKESLQARAENVAARCDRIEAAVLTPILENSVQQFGTESGEEILCKTRQRLLSLLNGDASDLDA